MIIQLFIHLSDYLELALSIESSRVPCVLFCFLGRGFHQITV